MISNGNEYEKLSASTRTTIFLRRKQLEELRKLTAETGVAMAYIIRDGIDMAIKKWHERMR